MNKLFSFLPATALAILTISVSSCHIFQLGKDSVSSSSAYVTIGSESGSPVFFMDGGGVIYPSKESVAKLTDNKGFGENKRALFYFNYNDEELSYSEVKKEYTVRNADLTFGRYLDMGSIKTKAQAESENLFAEDSVYNLDAFRQVWVYRGYLNVSGTGSYVRRNEKSIQPSVNLVYDPADISNNEIKFTLLYNRHAEKNAITYSSYELINSYDITGLYGMIPGTDSVTVTVETKSLGDQKFKFSRKDFLFRETVQD